MFKIEAGKTHRYVSVCVCAVCVSLLHPLSTMARKSRCWPHDDPKPKLLLLLLPLPLPLFLFLFPLPLLMSSKQRWWWFSPLDFIQAANKSRHFCDWLHILAYPFCIRACTCVYVCVCATVCVSFLALWPNNARCAQFSRAICMFFHISIFHMHFPFPIFMPKMCKMQNKRGRLVPLTLCCYLWRTAKRGLQQRKGTARDNVQHATCNVVIICKTMKMHAKKNLLENVKIFQRKARQNGWRMQCSVCCYIINISEGNL